jgi:hypothetical protein
MGVKAGPRIVQNGLILDVDAAVSRSYSGSGLTANGLVGGIGGTLINGVGYGTANNGHFIFDGTNDQIQISQIGSALLSGSQDFTISAWVQSSGGTGTIFANYLAGNLQVLYSPSYIGLWLNGAVAYANTATYYSANIVNLVAQRSSGTNITIYLNGQVIKTGTSNSTIGTTLDFRIGANTANGELFQGKLYNIQVYNRALTAQEIRQNYNATKKRYGL